MELLLILVFVGAYALLNAFVICGDCFFGYAITEKIMHPEWFPVTDLVAGSGSGNFLFYRLVANIPLFVDNFNLRDFVFSTPLTLLLVLAWYNIFWEITKNKRITLLAIFFLLFSDTKLFLHGYPIPFFVLTSIGSIHFLQIFGLYFFIKSRYVASFILLAISFYLHPASGLVFTGILSTYLLLEAYKTKNYKILLKPLVIAALLMLPNVYLLSSNLVLTEAERQAFFDISHSIKQCSSLYVNQYFHGHYIYTFAALGLMLVLWKRKFLAVNHESKIVTIVVVGFIGSMLWLLNLYVIQNLNVFYTMVIVRAFYIIKPLLILYILYAFNDLFFRKNILAKALALLLVISLITLSSLVGGIILAIISIGYLLDEKNSLFGRKETSDEEKRTLKIVIVCVILLAATFGYLRNNKFYKFYQLLQGNNVFNFSFDFDENYSISKKDPEFSELIDWAKQFKGKMFVVPIDGRDNFVYFRYMTKNGIYANIDDLGQLPYSPKDFLEEYQRMTDLGFKIIGPDVLDFAAYQTISFETLRATNADFAIFDKKSSGYIARPETPVFETGRFVVYQLK